MLKVYAIFDKKTTTFGTPFFTPTDNGVSANRLFERVCMDSETVISRSPADFDLYEIGEYDEQTSKITHLTPEFKTSAVQSVRNAILQMKELNLPEEVLKSKTPDSAPENMG